MNVFKNIFARVWALWGLISFIITFFIIFLPAMLSYLLPVVKGQSYFIFISKLWMNFWLFLVGCSVKISGKENFKKGETYVVVFNHNALLDAPLSAPYVPGPNKTIAKSSFAKVPLFGWFYSKGSILINRKDEKSRVKSFEEMKMVLQSGIHMCIYPEGTRNRTKESLKPFYDGAFKLAVASGKKIIPCVIKGTKRAMPVDKTFYLLPTPLTMHFMKAVAVENISVADLKASIFNAMKEEYENNYRS
ncbi:MAG: lysophospholipid acyltransferase family protein [Ferruginibacter sp.]